MCINYTLSNEFKNKVISKIDAFNGGLFDFIESFDDKCTDLGNYFIRKYKFYFESNRYSRAYYRHYNQFNSNYNDNDINTPLSPDEYEQVTIPETQDVKQNIIQTIQPLENNKNSLELVEKHMVDNKESFLDDAWDIIYDTY